MNGLTFLTQMSHYQKMEAPKEVTKLSAREYFETEAGLEMIRFISERIEVLDERSFKIVDAGKIQQINKHPLYRGRDFFQDMEQLSFYSEMIARKSDVIEVETWLFYF